MNNNIPIEQQTEADLRKILKPLNAGFLPDFSGSGVNGDPELLLRSILVRGIMAEINSRTIIKMVPDKTTSGSIPVRISQ